MKQISKNKKKLNKKIYINSTSENKGPTLKDWKSLVIDKKYIPKNIDPQKILLESRYGKKMK